MTSSRVVGICRGRQAHGCTRIVFESRLTFPFTSIVLAELLGGRSDEFESTVAESTLFGTLRPAGPSPTQPATVDHGARAHGDLPASQAPERNPPGAPTLVHQEDSGCGRIDQRGGESNEASFLGVALLRSHFSLVFPGRSASGRILRRLGRRPRDRLLQRCQHDLGRHVSGSLPLELSAGRRFSERG